MFIQDPQSAEKLSAGIVREMTTRRALLAMLSSAAPMAVLPAKPRMLPGEWAFFRVVGDDWNAPTRPRFVNIEHYFGLDGRDA